MTIENLDEVASELRERSRAAQGLSPVVDDDRIFSKVASLMRPHAVSAALAVFETGDASAAVDVGPSRVPRTAPPQHPGRPDEVVAR